MHYWWIFHPPPPTTHKLCIPRILCFCRMRKCCVYTGSRSESKSCSLSGFMRFPIPEILEWQVSFSILLLRCQLLRDTYKWLRLIASINFHYILFTLNKSNVFASGSYFGGLRFFLERVISLYRFAIIAQTSQVCWYLWNWRKPVANFYTPAKNEFVFDGTCKIYTCLRSLFLTFVCCINLQWLTTVGSFA